MFLDGKVSLVNGTLDVEYQDPQYNYYAYDLWASVLILTILPFVALLFLNGSIIAAVRRSTQLHKTQDRSEGNTTNILFCIVIIFIILHLPRVTWKFLYFQGSAARLKNNYWIQIKSIEILALTINSSVNFIIYSLVGRNFREEFVKVFKCKRAPASDTITSEVGEELSLEEYT